MVNLAGEINIKIGTKHIENYVGSGNSICGVNPGMVKASSSESNRIEQFFSMCQILVLIVATF